MQPITLLNLHKIAERGKFLMDYWNPDNITGIHPDHRNTIFSHQKKMFSSTQIPKIVMSVQGPFREAPDFTPLVPTFTPIT